jgi:hypothetical protein
VCDLPQISDSQCLRFFKFLDFSRHPQSFVFLIFMIFTLFRFFRFCEFSIFFQVFGFLELYLFSSFQVLHFLHISDFSEFYMLFIVKGRSLAPRFLLVLRPDFIENSPMPLHEQKCYLDLPMNRNAT